MRWEAGPCCPSLWRYPSLQANHLLHVDALRGETLHGVLGSELTRCTTFTTKDTVEELVKPYLEVRCLCFV